MAIEITPDTMVSEVLEERPDAREVFRKHGVEVDDECEHTLDNPLELCETMCHIDDFEDFMKDLKAFMEKPAPAAAGKH